MLMGAIAGLGGAALGAAGNFAGTVANSALNWHYAKKAAALNYNYQEKLAENQPSWHVTGLEKAGLNPILAAHGSYSGGLNVTTPVGGDSKIGQSALEGAGAAAGIANVMADTKKKAAEAKATAIQAKAAERTSKAAEWQIWDNKAMTEAGIRAWVEIGGKDHSVTSMRINKVTGEAFTLDGQQIHKISYTDVPSSAKQSSTPFYQLIKFDGSGFNSAGNAPTLTIPADGIKINQK